jgi:antitoxin PrlF
MATATLTSKGQLTLPIELRTDMGLRAGSKIEFVLNDDGNWLILPKKGDIHELKGIINYTGPTISVEDMEKAALEAAGAEFRESLK